MQLRIGDDTVNVNQLPYPTPTTTAVTTVVIPLRLTKFCELQAYASIGDSLCIAGLSVQSERAICLRIHISANLE